MRRITPIIAASLGIVLASLAAAQPSAQPATRPAANAPAAAHARVTLLAESQTFVPGTPFTVAVIFKMDPAWHVYFKDPGESGMPPDVRWDLPAGLTAGELRFPTPEVLKTTAGTNFVYHDEVALLVTMTPAAGLAIGRDVSIGADVRWLECDADLCLPGKQSATLVVTAGDRATPVSTEQFDAYRVKIQEAASFDPAAHR